MHTLRTLPLFAAGLAILLGAAAARAATAATSEAPTADAINTLLDAGKFQEALDGITRILDPKNTASYDRTKVLMSRAECYLQLKKEANALNVLEDVRKQADKDKATKDEAAAQSMILLIRRSSDGKYRPKTSADKTPLDILDRKARKAAYEALFADELASCKQDARDAASGISIVPIMTLANRIDDLLSLERLTTGRNPQTSAFAKEVAATCNTIIQQADNAFSRTIEDASVKSHVMVGPARNRKPAGLGNSDSESLHQIVLTCQRIIDLIPKLRLQLDQPNILVNALSRAQRIQVRANAVLEGGVDPTKNIGRNPDDPPPGNHQPFSDTPTR
jgi:hypothetical protein